MLGCDDVDEVDIPEDDVESSMDVDQLEAFGQTSQAWQNEKPKHGQRDSERWRQQKDEIERIGACVWTGMWDP
jgi:hypothetical protein